MQHYIRSAADFGPVSKNADYFWGAEVARAGVRPGDIVQFRDYVYEEAIETKHSVNTASHARPHYSGIVERVGEHGIITVLEQNIADGGGIRRTELCFESGSFVREGATVTVKVSGKTVFYRLQAR